jgi:hypothetical protein
MKKYLLTLTFGFLVIFAVAQVQTDTTYRLPAKEKLHYKIYYKLSKIWINAGVANFKTDTLINNDTLLYRFTADGFTLNKYQWIYSLEDHYESIADYNTLQPLRFEKDNTEKGIWVHNIYNFYPDEHKIDMFMEASKKHPIKKTETFNGFITDALSAIYYIRSLNFNGFTEGDTLTFKTILDGRIFDQSMVYLGKDMLKTADGNEIEAFKLGAIIENSTFFRGDDAVVVWITNNRQRWLAKAKAKIVVGSIIVYLDKKGLISFVPK